jgi:hypothetical protein
MTPGNRSKEEREADPEPRDATTAAGAPLSSRARVSVSGLPPAIPPSEGPSAVPTTQAAVAEPTLPRCDVCDTPITPAVDGDEGTSGGSGLYVWVRHGEVVYEEPPLCAACSSAITLSALQRWITEEDEG